MVHIEEIVRALRELGHEVAVIGPPATERVSFGADAGTVAALKRSLPAAVYEWLELAYSALAFFRLWRAYRRLRPDVLYERYNLFMLAGAWLKLLTGLPMLLEVNAPLAEERRRFGGLANAKLAARTERLTWQSADFVLPVTSVLAGHVRRAGVAGKRIAVLQNGVGREFLSGEADGRCVRARHGLEERVVLGFAGFVREWHGLERVLDILMDPSLGARLHFLIVGAGPAIPPLKSRVAAAGLGGRVTFAGLVPRQDMADFVAAFDIALQPHVVPYASPLKLFEYMAMGRAIVAPSTPNIREVLSEREAALFDPETPGAFRAAVEQLCRDPDRRARLGAAARDALLRQGLTWADNARRITALFEQALAAEGRSPAAAHLAD